MNVTQDLRPSPIAGQWYPGHPERLASSVNHYLQAASLPAIPGEVIAVIAPHAGHRYSGAVAGYAFAALRDRRADLVAVIAPMHHPYREAVLTSAHQAYQTPLGNIPIDRTALQTVADCLLEKTGTPISAVRADPEHSLEIELPFLQQALVGEFQLLPLMLRDHSEALTQALGHCLAQVLADRNAILVASTDLSHFYPQELANKLDHEMLRRIAAFDPLAVLQAEQEGQAFACGRAAVATVMWAAQALGGDTVTVLNYATSGDISGDLSQVVGYGAVAISRPAGVVDPD
ncbi:MAG: AmmeMemoRadiSam system protein B [Anaerolineales bacterium]|nr:AmmeMemoRadiSam system protein B [Anaerolineales bacterium]